MHDEVEDDLPPTDWHVAPERAPESAPESAPAAKEVVSQAEAPIGRQRTGVVSVVDLPGENDGCDRCFGSECDEERCCPSFWQDENHPPPIWPLSWIFARDNKLLNDNHCAEAVGHCGLVGADSERKLLMGIALGFTVFSIILTTFGCLGLSSNPSLVRVDAWAIGHLANEAESEGTIAWVGLGRLVIQRCADIGDGKGWHEWRDCALYPHWWSEVPRKCGTAQAAHGAAVLAGNETDRIDDEFGYPCDVLLVCAEQAAANQFGALITCVTLVFALIGCLTRIRKRADTNFQKLIGTVPDLIGVISLGAALATFSVRCTFAMVDDGHGHGTGYEAGHGFVAYCFCWLAAVVRCTMHAVMPVPGAGLSLARSLGWTTTSSAAALVAQRQAEPSQPTTTPKAKETYAQLL